MTFRVRQIPRSNGFGSSPVVHNTNWVPVYWFDYLSITNDLEYNCYYMFFFIPSVEYSQKYHKYDRMLFNTPLRHVYQPNVIPGNMGHLQLDNKHKLITQVIRGYNNAF
jgi:hypothetical protein